MKRYFLPILLTTVLIVGTVIACKEKNLDVKPVIATEDTYFLTEAQFREGILGVYSKLIFLYAFRGGSFLDDVRLLPDDDLTTVGANPFENFDALNAGNGKVSDYYSYLYQMINRANAILAQISQKGDAVLTNKTTRDNFKGELLFLRAQAYFQLWNLYGTAPLVTERTTSTSNLYPANSSDTQLLDQAITDLTTAAPLLPDAWPAADKGRVTKGGGYAMLGKAYLYRATVKKAPADYTAALQAFDRITGAKLTANFSDNFRKDKENNEESLFEVQLGASVQTNNIWLTTDDFGVVGDLSGYWGYFDGNFALGGTPKFVPTTSFLASADTLDPRYAHTVTKNGASVVKYVEFGGGDANGAGYYNNARVIRLADVKLMRAEALVQSGGSLADAIALINEIRARARQSGPKPSLVPADRPATETNRTTVLRWIIEERRQELAFEEGHRWYDLRRWHLGGILQTVYGKDLTNWDFSSVRNDFKFNAKSLYLPIPSSELSINASLKQNPGY